RLAAAIGGVALLLAIIVAYRFGGHISHALASVSSIAAALRLNERPGPLATTAFRETNALASALSSASIELHHIQQQSHLALEAANLGTWTKNIATGEFSASPRLKDIFGIASDEDLSLRKMVDCVHPSDRSVLEQTICDNTPTAERFELQL